MILKFTSLLEHYWCRVTRFFCVSQSKKIGTFGACENLFPLKENLSHHEINLAFLVEVSSGIKLKSIEEHIEFVLVDKDSLADYALLPKSFKEGIIGWLENKQTFFRSFD